MVRLASTLLLPVGLASAATMLTPRQNSTGIPRKLIVGAPGQILSYDYDGTTFTKTANSSAPDTTASWMIFKHPNLLYAVDENSNNTRLFNFSPLNSSLSAEPVSVGVGSLGVVSLAFDKDQTHLFGTSYTQGQVDVWDISSPDGSLNLVKQVPLPGPDDLQGEHKAHQAVLDPTGQFFAIADLGGDAIHFMNSSTWEINNSVQVEPSGAGPRHGAFIGGDATTLPSHYVVVCELKNIIILWELEQTVDGKINMTNPQTLSTFQEGFPPANATSAAAGELIAASNGRDVYITNRVTGNETDSIVQFSVENCELKLIGQVSSYGVNPRMLSFSDDESLVFGTNIQGDNGLVAFKRCPDTGTLTMVSTLANSEISTEVGFGPQFIHQIPLFAPLTTKRSIPSVRTYPTGPRPALRG